MRGTTAYLCPKMNDFDAMGFSECHSKEVIAIFWCQCTLKLTDGSTSSIDSSTLSRIWSIPPWCANYMEKNNKWKKEISYWILCCKNLQYFSNGQDTHTHTCIDLQPWTFFLQEFHTQPWTYTSEFHGSQWTFVCVCVCVCVSSNYLTMDYPPTPT